MADKSSSLRFDDGSLKPLERSLEGKGREFDLRPELDFFDGFVPKFGYAAHHVARLGAKGPGLKPSEEFSETVPASGTMAWVAHQLKNSARPQDSRLSPATQVFSFTPCAGVDDGG